MTATISAELITGMKIWPAAVLVWRIVMRGMKPSWIACCVTEKAPEITACEAMTAARLAMMSSGHWNQSGAR